MCFPLPPLEAALSIFDVSFFKKKNTIFLKERSDKVKGACHQG
jgi:hypothetical protein